MYRALYGLRTHPNIAKLHIELVWKTFLEDSLPEDTYHRMEVGPSGPAWRQELRDVSVEFVQSWLPLATVTDRVSDE